jgi:hypothetical protein
MLAGVVIPLTLTHNSHNTLILSTTVSFWEFYAFGLRVTAVLIFLECIFLLKITWTILLVTAQEVLLLILYYCVLYFMLILHISIYYTLCGLTSVYCISVLYYPKSESRLFGMNTLRISLCDMTD